MPFISAVSKIDFPYKLEQEEVKKYARETFSSSFPDIDRIIGIFDNTEIRTRNICKPIEYFQTLGSFEERNKEYINTSLEYSIKAIDECTEKAGVSKHKLTDIIF